MSGQICVEHRVADLVVGLQIPHEDIDIALQKHFVRSAGITMHVAESSRKLLGVSGLSDW